MNRKVVKCACVSGLLLLLAVGSGCSSFGPEWRKASAAAPPPTGITGRWEGRWLSGKNGHTGKLQCLITELPDGRYRNFYHATFWKLFRASYHIDSTATVTNGTYTLTGSMNLGSWCGGVYEHRATVTSDNFTATYSCTIDHGIFEMKRVK